jgi:hypothetical protein
MAGERPSGGRLNGAGRWDDPFVNAPARPPRGELEGIRFSDGREAVVWLDNGRDPGELPGILGLPAGGGPVIVVCGGADTRTGSELSRAADMLGPGVSGAAARRAGGGGPCVS